MTDLSRYPLNFDALKRGDSLSASECEKILAIGQSDDRYWKKLLRLKTEIEEHFEERGDLSIVATTRDNGIQILTEEEASPYLQKRDKEGRGIMKRAIAKGALIDRSKLLDATREQHDRWLIVATHRLQMMRTRPKLSDNGNGQKQIT